MIDRGPRPGKEATVHADADMTRLSVVAGDCDLPAAHAEAAETVRRALVRLRGGTPLLSPADERLLLGWLEAGVGVGRILRALELAADRRVARRVRAPLTVAHAKALLAKGRPAPVVADAPPPPAPDVEPPSDGAPAAVLAALAALATRVARLDTSDAEAAADQLADWALAAQDAAWAGLSDGERASWLSDAEAGLADVLDLLDEGERASVIEAHGRARLREAFPAWSVARLVDQVLG